MQQVSEFWSGLDTRRQVLVVAATVGMFLAVLGLARFASTPGMALLYAGLDPLAAGEVVQALEQRNIRYSVQGDAIYVPTHQRDETRMLLAARSLPANGAAGYELLDNLSGFSTTSQMFDAAYWRAKEGELARTIAAGPGIRSARVHIAQGSSSAFRREAAPRASVTVSSAVGPISAEQARALRFLVSAAVAGMDPGNVSIIDADSGLVAGSEDESSTSGRDRSDALRKNVERLLEAHVGPGRAVVEMSIDTVTDRETITERRFDPESRVAISTESEERNRTATDSRNPGVTVASNLPDGDAAETDGSSESREVETRERANFEVSETQRELHRAPGAVRRLTVAVLVDGHHGPEAGDWTPRSAEELEALHDLVASAVGYDEARGDVITLRSLRFEPVPPEGTLATTPRLGLPMPDPLALAGIVALLLLGLVLALFVLRPILRAARSEQPALPAVMAPAALQVTGPQQAEQVASGVDDTGLDGDIGDLFGEDSVVPMGLDFDGDGGGDGGGGRSSSMARDESDPVARLRALIAERQEESIEILRHWMEENGTQHR